MNRDEQHIAEMLEQHATKAPAGFAKRVMEAVPEATPGGAARWWPAGRLWFTPALAGAAAALLLFSAGHWGYDFMTPVRVEVHFELHALGAQKVELLGTFNNWKSGDIILNGPDASGHWTATILLPEGRHEYIFLVDGERWVADPNGLKQRPDGFGRVNTIIKVGSEDGV